jgi:hypothetical protein
VFVSEQHKLPGDPELSRLYRSGRHEVPPEALDQKILSTAQRVALRRRRSRWIIPLSSAALLLLGVGLSLPLIDLPQIPAERQELRSVPAQQSVAPEQAPESTQPAATPSSARGAPSLKRLQERSSHDGRGSEAVPREMQAAPKTRPSPAFSLGKAEETDAELQDFDSNLLTPEQWLQEIEGLIRSGRHQQAKARLDQFIATYPEHPLPRSLQQWSSNRP